MLNINSETNIEVNLKPKYEAKSTINSKMGVKRNHTNVISKTQNKKVASTPYHINDYTNIDLGS